MRTLACASLALLLVGCGNDNNSGDMGMGGMDMAVNVPDLSSTDLAGVACNPTDPMNDGTACPAPQFSCPSGQKCVQDGANFTCRLECTAGVQGTCPCDRTCVTLTDSDGGAAGAACIPGNTAGERCNVMNGQPICAQNLNCAGMANGPAYCLIDCGGQNDCPIQTQCQPITNNGMQVGLVCVYLTDSSAQALQPGAACNAATLVQHQCVAGYLCDVDGASPTCKPQCDGPGATCASGTCTIVNDPAKNKTIGYVCK